MAVFGAVGLLCLGTGLTRLVSAWNAASWPATDGVITESRLEAQVDAETSSLVAHLSYEYTVDGRQYRSSRISLAQRSLTNDDWSRELVAAHPVGAAVRVRYHPERPERSALFVGATPASSAQPLVGLAFLGIAFAVYLRSRGRAGAPAR